MNRQYLVQRWEGTLLSLDSNYLPFGRTQQNLKDFRGAPLSSTGKLQGKRFSEYDFSVSDFKDVWLEDCLFEDSAFCEASFVNVSDHGNQFTRCSFEKTDFPL